jgi:LAO/AO transport system kinase
VVYTADLVVVLSVPGLGDDVQSIKAGILEIGDIFAVNKADLPGADKVAYELTQMLTLGDMEQYRREVLMVSAEKNQGIAELCGSIDACYQEMSDDGRLHARRTRRLRRELLEVIRQEILSRLFSSMNPELSKDYQAFIDRRENPYDWVNEIILSLNNMEGATK